MMSMHKKPKVARKASPGYRARTSAKERPPPHVGDLTITDDALGAATFAFVLSLVASGPFVNTTFFVSLLLLSVGFTSVLAYVKKINE